MQTQSFGAASFFVHGSENLATVCQASFLKLTIAMSGYALFGRKRFSSPIMRLMKLEQYCPDPDDAGDTDPLSYQSGQIPLPHARLFDAQVHRPSKLR